MIMINLSSFTGGRDAQEAAVRRFLLPLLQPSEREPHAHPYAIILADLDTGTGYQLQAFEAPCAVSDDAGNIRAVVAALRETADELEAGHADILAEDEPADDTQKDEG